MAHCTARSFLAVFFTCVFGWSVAPVSGADDLYVFPREYWRMADNERVVGDGGRLALIETDEGEEIEVVEYLPSRQKQRDGDILLFSTAKDPDRPVKTLERPYRSWQNGRESDAVFKQPDEVDRTIYRRDSSAYDDKVKSLFETARLNALLAKLHWFLHHPIDQDWIDESVLPEPLGILYSGAAYDKIRAYLRSNQHTELYLRGLIENLGRIPAMREEIAVNDKALQALQKKNQETQQELAALRKQVGERVTPKGDPIIRRRDILAFEDYEQQADMLYLQESSEKSAAQVRDIILHSAGLLTDELGVAPEKIEETFTDAGPEPLNQLVNLLEHRLELVRQRRVEFPDVHSIVLAAARQLPEWIETVKEAEKGGDERTQFIQSYGEAFVETPEAEAESLLAEWVQALETISAVDFGRYRVTFVSRLEGIEQAVGTPIQVTIGGITRTFHSYQWPGTDDFHEIIYDIELRESPEHMLELKLPSPQAALNKHCPDMRAYNMTRLKGWSLKDQTTFQLLAEKMFSVADKAPAEVVQDYMTGLYHAHGGTLEIEVKLIRTKRLEQALASPQNGHTSRRVLGAPDASLDAVLLDYFRIEKVAEPALVLRQTLVQRNWIKPEEQNRFMAWIHNRTEAEQTGQLRVYWTRGFNQETLIDERQVTVEPNSFARFTVPWQAPSGAPFFGHEIRMELIADDVTTTAIDVFSIHPNCFAVFLFGGESGYDVYRGPKNYRNNTETFGVTHCDSVCILPDDRMRPYIRGMSGPLGHLILQRAEAQRNEKIGVSSVHYLSPLCTAYGSYEYYLKHPEWWPARLKWTEQMNNNSLALAQAFKDLYDKGEPIDVKALTETYPVLHLEQPVNHAPPLIFNNLVEDLITYSYLVPWDGTRWDGGPMTVFSHDFLGRVLKHPKTGEPVTTLEQRKDLAADMFKELKQRIWEHHPHWVYGNNGDTFGYGATLLTLENEPPDVQQYPHYREFMKGKGSYMDEGWMSAYIFSDQRNKARDYLRIGFKQSMEMKKNGGYLQTFSPERDGNGHFNVDFIYYTLLPHIFGASYYGMMSASPWSEDGPAHFFTRFREFFMDTRIRAYPQAEERIEADIAGVWFTESATIRPLTDNHVQVIIPVINKHPRERLYDNQSRYSELPYPIEQTFSMSVRSPRGFDAVVPAVWELSCEPRTAATQLEAQVSDGVAAFELAGVKLFKVIVLDYRRGQG